MKIVFSHIFIFAGLMALTFGFTYSALAAEGKFVPLTAIPGVTSGQESLVGYINALFRLGIGLAALLAVIRFGIAGIKYMGNDSYSSKASAKEDIKEVLLGLLIILATVIILQTINPQILNLNILGPGGTTFKTSSGQTSSAPAAQPPATQTQQIERNQQISDWCKGTGGFLERVDTPTAGGVAVKCNYVY